MSSTTTRGMPLLSAPPPDLGGSQPSCRRCNKEFFPIISRSRKCNHCGYSYCHSCSDYSALLPRSGTESGYTPVSVCAFCFKYLTITAAGKNALRKFPLNQLKDYIAAYGIVCPIVLEKDDVVDAIISARGPNGCLPSVNENYYRRNSVPNARTSRPRGMFSTRSPNVPPPPRNAGQSANTPWNNQNAFPRPDLETDSVPHQSTSSANPRQRTTSAQQQPPYTPYTSSRQRAQQQGGSYPYSGDHARRSSDPNPRSPSRPPPPPPSLDELLTLDRSVVAAYPVSTLKAILYAQHVPASSKLVLEKSDLVERVWRLVEEERRDRERLEEIRIAEETVEREEKERRERRNEFGSGVGTSSGPSRGAWNNRGTNQGSSMDVDEPGPSGWEFERDRERALARERSRSPQPPLTEPNSATQPAPGVQYRRSRQARVDVEQESDSGSTYEVSIHGSDDGNLADTNVDSDVMDVREDNTSGHDHHITTPTIPPHTTGTPPKPLPPHRTLERSGLCVVCQDEEANMVMLDCGHLALCRSCADLVMASTRECPLCRTRIITEARLLRVYKT